MRTQNVLKNIRNFGIGVLFAGSVLTSCEKDTPEPKQENKFSPNVTATADKINIIPNSMSDAPNSIGVVFYDEATKAKYYFKAERINPGAPQVNATLRFENPDLIDPAKAIYTPSDLAQNIAYTNVNDNTLTVQFQNNADQKQTLGAKTLTFRMNKSSLVDAYVGWEEVVEELSTDTRKAAEKLKQYGESYSDPAIAWKAEVQQYNK